MTDVTDQLLREGVEKFVEPMDKLLEGIGSKREAIVTQRPPSIDASLPDEDVEPRVAARVKRAAEEDVARRIWRKDDTLWGPAGQPEVANRLGWLTVTEQMREELGDLQAFAEAVRDEGVKDVVLLGMGGSSLAPEVIRRSFGEQAGWPSLHVLDSTDAGAVRGVEQRHRPRPRALPRLDEVRRDDRDAVAVQALLVAAAGRAARSSPSPTRAPAWRSWPSEHGFRRTFLNDPDIGGRYSALSFFGLVPAALMGADVAGILHAAGVAEQNCQSFESRRRVERAVARARAGASWPRRAATS